MTAPFPLPPRAPVTPVAGRTAAAIRAPDGQSTQTLPGFEPQWRDIVHYIVGITEEIWTDMAVDRIRATYAEDCVIHTSMGTVRGVAGVISGTVQSLWAFTGFSTEHVSVTWNEQADGFYTSHLGFGRSVNTGATAYGPATNAPLARHFCADCVTADNKIHTEWLSRDTATGIIQMGLTTQGVAKTLAAHPVSEPLAPYPGDAPAPVAGDPATMAGFFVTLFAHWNMRAFAAAGRVYADGAVAHWPGLREGAGPRAIALLYIGLFASIPDGVFRIEHISWSDEGPTVAVRWRLDGASSPLGAIGEMPGGKPVALIGFSHFRFGAGGIVEEWTVFDEVAVIVQALRG
ncbi:ester cyclase [Sphingomonas sp.]|uniref:nuclear transport factor 2 family protein n=1 Tax=Sphingomonas sp. TaxID=28214 RepID=UPI003CC65425